MEHNSNSLNIQTVRLEIRNLHMQDLPGFYAYRSNPEVTKYQGFDVMSVEQAKAFIEDNASKKFSKAGEWVQYAIAETIRCHGMQSEIVWLCSYEAARCKAFAGV